MKIVIVQVVLLLLVWAGYFGYRSTQPTQPSADSYELLTQAGRSLSFYAKDLRSKNVFIRNTVTKMVNEFHSDSEVMKKHAQDCATIQDLTTDMLKTVENLRNAAIKAAGGYTEQNSIKDNQGIAKVDKDQLMETVVILGKFREQLSKISGVELAEIMYDTDQKPVKPAQFANLYFASKPLALFLMNLARVEADVIEMEKAALIEVGSKANYVHMEFEELVPVIKPASYTVNNGDTYQAEIFFTRKLSNANPSLMMVNGEAVKSEKGYGQLSMEVRPPFARKEGEKVKGIDAIVTVSSKAGTRSFTTKENIIIK